MFRLNSMLRSVLVAGVADLARSVAGCGFPGVDVVPGPGWNGCKPRGVSTIVLKCPVNGGAIFEGLV